MKYEQKGGENMKYLIISNYDYVYSEAKANFEIPKITTHMFIAFQDRYHESGYDDEFVDFLHKNYEIYLKEDIDLFIYVQDGEIYVRERK